LFILIEGCVMSLIKLRVATSEFAFSSRTSAVGRRWLAGLGLSLLANAMAAPIVQAQLAVGSVLNLSARSTNSPPRRVTIELADSSRLVYRSGQFGVASTPAGSAIALGSLDRQVAVLPSTDSFAQAYADVTTAVGDLPLDSAGGLQADIPNFIQNISLKTADGNRQLVNFTLKTVNFNPQTNIGEVTGIFVDAAGKEYPAIGEFALDPTAGCKCSYTMQLKVLPGEATPLPDPTPTIGGGGGGGGAWPLLLLAAALPFAFGNDSDNAASAPPPVPGDAVPTPALLPAAIGLFWKVRRRQRSC
jgi:hypothetical protein